ncbi:MAG: TVP38/TMEM64 family protein [Candidatus Tenebribacter mawsonii]|nr:TVP38/TMEM64 family protein [Candidatus Tenebribacter mawsonii]
MKPYQKKLLIVIILLLVILAIRLTGVHKYLTFENLQKQKDVLQNYVDGNYLLAVIMFVLIYAVSVAFSIPGATILTLTGGLVFGTILGAIYVNVGATAGAIGVFIFARYLLGAKLQEKYAEKLAKFNKEIETNGYSYLLTLRFIPLFPFWMINLFAGLTKIPLRTYAWTTAFGILPGSLVYTYTGNQLNTINSVKDIFSWNILLAFILLGLLALFPTILNHIKKRKKS